jgi:hypothetical protein
MSADERRRAAVHESAHALAAAELGFVPVAVHLGGESGSSASFRRRDSHPSGHINGRDRPRVDPGCWHDFCDEATVALVGPLAEELLADDLPALDPDAGLLSEAQCAIESVAVAGDEPDPYLVPVLTDDQVAERLVASITGSELEASALLTALRLRARRLVESERFRVGIAHMAVVIEQAGSLVGPALRCEVGRARLRAGYDEALDEAA